MKISRNISLSPKAAEMADTLCKKYGVVISAEVEKLILKLAAKHKIK